MTYLLQQLDDDCIIYRAGQRLTSMPYPLQQASEERPIITNGAE